MSYKTVRTIWIAARITLVFTVLLGVLYPLAVWGVGQVLTPGRAGGSLLRDAQGEVRGSVLIGQSFAGADGAPLPQYFQGRPSAAGDGYDARASSGSNLGPESKELIGQIRSRREAVAKFNGVPQSEVPTDALAASASGLDPHISPQYARIQLRRVARARGLSVSVLSELLEQHVQGRQLGFLGQPRVNVLELNLALDELTPPSK
jgi:K+-transporting ATPase ATPase C chain